MIPEGAYKQRVEPLENWSCGVFGLWYIPRLIQTQRLDGYDREVSKIAFAVAPNNTLLPEDIWSLRV